MINIEQFKQFFALVLKYLCSIVLSGVLVCLFCAQIQLSPWWTLLVCMVISVLVPNAVFYLLLRRDEQFRQALRFADRLTKNKLRLEKRLLPKE